MNITKLSGIFFVLMLITLSFSVHTIARNDQNGGKNSPLFMYDVGIEDIIINPINPEIGDSVKVEVVMKNYGSEDILIDWGYSVTKPSGEAFGSGDEEIMINSLETFQYEYFFNTDEVGDHWMVFRVNTHDRDVFDENTENNQEMFFLNIGEVTTCLGDINVDGMVGQQDLNLIMSEWGMNGSDADLDLSGIVDFKDLTIVLSNWGNC